MEEAYVSYEIAELLKKKGFDEPTSLVWYEKYPSQNACRCSEIGKTKMDLFYLDERTERSSQYNNTMSIPSYIYGNIFSAPTHQMACAWLREVHNILIIPRWVYDNNNSSVVYGYTIFKVFPLPYKDYSNGPIWYIEYNDAMEAALKYCLENLI